MNNQPENKTKTKKVVKIAISAFLGAILVFLLSVLIRNTIALNNNEIASYFGYSITYVPTNSMSPTIEAGDTVLVEECDINDIKTGEDGDIVVYFDGEKYIIHRAIGKDETGALICKGDNPYIVIEDPKPVTDDMLYGRYVKTVNLLSFTSIFKNNNFIFPLCILIFAGILVSELVAFMHTLSQKRKEELAKALKEIEDKKLEVLKQELLKELEEELASKNKQ